MPAGKGALPPPPGVTPNFDYSNPWLYLETRDVIIAGIVFATVFLALRIYTRTFVIRKFGWDDVTIILAWAWGNATQATCLYGYSHGGIGIHIWNVTAEMLLSFQKNVFVAGIIYIPALAFAKASLIILYYRIMSQRIAYRWCLHILSFIVAGYSIAIALGLIFACDPIAKSWDKSITEGSCVDQNALYIATAVCNSVTDIALLVVPIPMVMSLNMPLVQKIGLLFMFLVGCATVITSIIRLVTLFPFLQSNDPTYKIAWTDLWINVEANFIVICSCLPSLRQFFRRHAPKWIGEGSSNPRYLNSYASETATRTRQRRKPGLTMLHDDVELAENGGSISSDARIVKEVHWNVVTEDMPDGSGRERSR